MNRSTLGRNCRIWLGAAVVATALGAVAQAASARRTVAIAYFDNNAGADLESLRKGLADMLITDLSGLGALQIVERDRLNDVLKELKLGQSRFIDAKSAQKLGKGLAAEYIMVGSYLVAGDTMRIDCRIVQVATGKVVGADKVEGKKDDFFSLEKDLVDLLVKTLNLEIASGERSQLRRNQTQSYQAWSRYGAGLDAHDRGDDAKARALFQEALEADPNYAAARTATERLRAIFKQTDDKEDQKLAALRRSLDAKAPDFGHKVNQLLQGYDSGTTPHLRQKVELLRWLVERDLTPSENGFSRVPSELLGLVSRYLDDPTQAKVIPAVCEYVVTRYPGDAAAQPQCKAYLDVIGTMADVWAKNPTVAKKAPWAERRKQATVRWQIAILETEAETLELFAACAKKTRR
jgi:TolB-like protein